MRIDCVFMILGDATAFIILDIDAVNALHTISAVDMIYSIDGVDAV